MSDEPESAEEWIYRVQAECACVVDPDSQFESSEHMHLLWRQMQERRDRQIWNAAIRAAAGKAWRESIETDILTLLKPESKE